MTKKLLYIALGAMFVFGILFLLWSWLFSGGGIATQNTGQFGTSTDATQNIVDNTGTSNGQTGLGQNTSNGSIPIGQTGNTVGSLSNANTGSGTSTVFTTSFANATGAQWLSGAGSNAGGNGFNPIAINNLDGASVGGTVPTIGGTITGDSNSNSGINTLIASGLIGVASCALQASGNSIGSLLGLGSGAGASVPAAAVSVPVNDIVTHSFQGAQAGNTVTKNVITFQGCLTNVLAKVALQQITASVVNWINSGFNGNPSFVTNYNQFFTNVADLAAGQFIQGAGLAFLCSPFQLQIKIAVAQAYANRGAQSCTLTGVVKNINNFMNGNFSQGGWPGLLSVTTVPTNNPYGAYAYAQIGLVSAQKSALSNAKNNISPTGFLNLQQQSCPNGVSINTTPAGGLTPSAGQNSQAAAISCPSGCTCKTTTPGSVIEGSLQNTLKSPIDQLGLATDLDQIITALTTQLVTKTLQGGLSNLSGTTGLQSSYQTPDQAAAQANAQTILTNLQAQASYAQQYGSILQGSIGDIENAQSSLSSLISCWSTAASSTALSSAQQAQASSNAAAAQSSFDLLTAQINSFNDAITQVNAETAEIEQLQTEALSIGSTADVQTLTNDYATAQSTQPFIAAADVTTAQQNRATLQSQLGVTNTSTQSGLAQCQAFGH